MNLSSPMGLGAIEPATSCVMAFPGAAYRGRRTSVRHDGAGYGTLLTIVRFVAWAHELSSFPMPEQVIARFNCSLATAHRWLNALEDCYGIERPRRGNRRRDDR